MPHFVLEISDNVLEQLDTQAFFDQVHSIAMRFGVFDLQNLKSRIIRHTEYRVGARGSNSAFIYLAVALLAGRSLDLRQALGKELTSLLSDTFARSKTELQCSITCEVREINSATHFKG